MHWRDMLVRELSISRVHTCARTYVLIFTLPHCAQPTHAHATHRLGEQVFEGSVLPCNSMMVVELGSSEAKIEAVFNDFVQVVLVVIPSSFDVISPTLH